MKYDWIVVGGGITGIALSEILTREGHSVLLIEKKDKHQINYLFFLQTYPC